MLVKLNLFDSKKELAVFLGIIFLILSVNISLKYHSFKELKSHKTAKIQAKVINQYKKTKHGKSYIVFKLRAKDGYTFYTTSREDLKNLYGDTLSLKMITKNITFLDFFKGFYAPVFDIWIDKKDRLKTKLLNFITSQHTNPLMKELFSALFLAKPVSKTLREKVSNLGISHLIAISGFHLGVLFFLLYFVFEKVYKFFQNRYFPYRNRRFDLSIFVIVLLFFYLYLLGFIPSLVRSYVMMAVGFYLYDRYFKIISFEVLFVAVLLILAFLPEFFFSIGFWFSVSGVFFIYMFLNYFSKLKPWQIMITLNIWVFIMMLPIVHFVFDKWTFLQLLSPLISIFFIIFYPLELFLHIIGHGDLLDIFVLKLFDLNSKIHHISTPLWFLVVYFLVNFYMIKKIKHI